MPPYSRPSCYVRVGSTDYKLRRDGFEINYMPNGWQVARCVVDLNESSPPSLSLFAGETAVSVKVESVSMMTGYVVTPERVCNPLTEKSPGKDRSLELLIADKVGYLTKGEYLADFFRSATIQSLAQSIAGTLGVPHSVSSSLSNTFKRSFYGTTCKDALNYIVDKGADWFGDESGTLIAWPQSDPPELQTGGDVYQIQDVASGADNELEVSHIHKYSYTPDDALQRYRNVKVMNSYKETWPQDIDQITSEMFWNGTLGYQTPRWITGIEAAGLTNWFRPGKSEPGPDMGGASTNAKAKAMAFYTEDTNDKLFATVWYIAGDDVSQSSQYLQIAAGAWDQLWFHIYTSIDFGDADSIELQLIDNSTGVYYHRDILLDINGSDQWTFLLYTLPTATSGASGSISNGWTKQGSGSWNEIDTVFISVIKSSTGDNTGWPVNSSLKLATFFFVRRPSVTSSGAATGLNLTKPIVNDTDQDISVMSDQALKERLRLAYATKAKCTVPGHTDFKRPGYQCYVNFDQTFGSGHSAELRMDKIRHYTDINGFYWMDMEFGPALQRL